MYYLTCNVYFDDTNFHADILDSNQRRYAEQTYEIAREMQNRFNNINELVARGYIQDAQKEYNELYSLANHSDMVYCFLKTPLKHNKTALDK